MQNLCVRALGQIKFKIYIINWSKNETKLKLNKIRINELN